VELLSGDKNSLQPTLGLGILLGRFGAGKGMGGREHVWGGQTLGTGQLPYWQLKIQVVTDVYMIVRQCWLSCRQRRQQHHSVIYPSDYMVQRMVELGLLSNWNRRDYPA